MSTRSHYSRPEKLSMHALPLSMLEVQVLEAIVQRGHRS